MKPSTSTTTASRKRRVHRRVSSFNTDRDTIVAGQQEHDAKRTKLCSSSTTRTSTTAITTIDQHAPAERQQHHSNDEGPSGCSSSSSTLPSGGNDVPSPSSSAPAVAHIHQLPRTVSAVAMVEQHPQHESDNANLEDKIVVISSIKKKNASDDVLLEPSPCPTRIISSHLSTVTLSSLDSNDDGSSSSSRSCSPALLSDTQLFKEPLALKPNETMNVGTPRNKPKSKRSKPRSVTVLMALVWSGLLAWVYSATTRTSTQPPPIEPGSVYVPGAGFSGFWYTLGRLRSIPDPSAHNFYCYSAGCLGVVAAMNGLDVEEVYDAAASMQTQWKTGEISRFDVVGGFVDYLLDRAAAANNNETSMDLSLLNVLTTAKDGWFGVRVSVQTPSNLDNLRTLLLQTTWIPYAVGDGLWHHGHMDGGAAALFHPKCEVHLDLPLDLDLLSNIVNVNLGREKVFQFWKKGLAYGL